MAFSNQDIEPLRLSHDFHNRNPKFRLVISLVDPHLTFGKGLRSRE